jgi:penicillin-binding protein 2
MSANNGNRNIVYIAVFLITAVIFLVRILFLQLNDKWEQKAINNALNKIPLSPARSIIYDRNGKLMVYNIAVYDLWVFPKDAKSLDTASFCKLLGITGAEYTKRLKEASLNSKKRQKNGQFNRSAIFMSNLSKSQYASIQENLYLFPGFVIEPKTDRLYAVKGGAHVLGYMGEVSEKTLKNDAYYRPGDLVGVTGIEATYESYIRGVKGQRTVWQDRTYVERGEVKNDEFNYPAEAGPDVYSSLDFGLQEFGEQLLTNKRGSIVAIEPSTGEVLALINKPDYDPNLLVGEARGRSFRQLLIDPVKPLYNRAIKGQYPPGSTFKTVMALIGMQEGVLNAETRHACHGGYHMGSLTVGCHPHASPTDLRQSIAISCNAYYCQVYRDIVDNPGYNNVKDGFRTLEKHLHSFGLGKPLGIDIPGEVKGMVPTVEQLDKRHGKSWRSSTTISMAIGQGEILLTPLQMANMAATIANRGYFYTPHLVKGIGPKKDIPEKYKVKHFTTVDTQHFRVVIDGMEKVVQPGGTAYASRIPGIVICGKTGTAQNPHGKDHSLFIAFAPRDNPKIAIAVIVENGGYGATWAAPMATLMIEQYLNNGATTQVPTLLDRILKGVVDQ